MEFPGARRAPCSLLCKRVQGSGQMRKPFSSPPRHLRRGTSLAEEKSEVLALVLSLVIPGAGQMYCGKIGRGVGILIVTIVLLLFFVGIIVYIWQIYDAYKCAQRYNREHMMRCPRCGNPVPMGAVACPTCGQPLMMAAPVAPYGTPGYGQPGYAQPGYGQPG